MQHVNMVKEGAYRDRTIDECLYDEFVIKLDTFF